MVEKKRQQIFSEWLETYQGLIFKIVRAYAFTADDRDDLFQDICLQIWKSIPRFRGESAVTTWLYRISLNTAMNWSAKERKHDHRDINEMHHVLHQIESEVDERLTWLYEQIAAFSEIDRSLILLLLDGFSYKEMANLLGISESNIGVKVHRIKKQLIKQSEKYEYHGV